MQVRFMPLFVYFCGVELFFSKVILLYYVNRTIKCEMLQKNIFFSSFSSITLKYEL